MTFQDRMKKDPSKLEEMIAHKLQNRKINNNYLENQLIIFYPTNCKIIEKKDFMRHHASQCITFTLPDQMTRDKCWAFYFDGPHHLTSHNSLRDAKINYQLEKYNIKYKRWSYKRPTKRLMNRIVDEMEALRLG